MNQGSWSRVLKEKFEKQGQYFFGRRSWRMVTGYIYTRTRCCGRKERKGRYCEFNIHGSVHRSI